MAATDGDPREQARLIVDAALAAVEPAAAVHRSVRLLGDDLHIGGAHVFLSKVDRVVVVGAGKAGVPMSRAIVEILGDRIAAGHVVVPHGQAAEVAGFTIYEAGHPVPDAAGVAAGGAVIDALVGLDERSVVICLVSGGGSALLVSPAPGIELEHLQIANQALLACGATIVEINTLRKHLSRVKGGQLARAAAPAPVYTLILSDVVGDPLDAIASGPTVPDTTSFSDCLAIVDRYDLAEVLPAPVVARLRGGAAGDIEETPKPGDAVFERVTNVLVANNDTAVRAAAAAAADLGYATIVLSTLIEGEAREVAKVHAAIAREVQRSGRPGGAPLCLISGGETTVTLKGQGSGGRNQEFVLAASLEIDGLDNILVCSVGTDGIDGTTDAAGAVADGRSAARARDAGIDPRACLADNDSHRVFAALDDLVVTGPTDTNVMDLRLLLVR